MTSPILLTGGAGTLGRLVTPLLLAAGCHVRVLSRRGHEPESGLEFMTGDLVTGEGVDAAVNGVETIVHCAGSTKQMETSFDVISIHRQAAASDRQVASDYRKVLDDRARAFAEFIHDLRADLAPGVQESVATDLLWCFSNEEIYRELVEERGWSADRFESWLAATLVAQLITTPTTGEESTVRIPPSDD